MSASGITHLEKLSEKVNTLSDSLKFRFTPPPQQWHNEDDFIVILRQFENIIYGDAVVERVRCELLRA
jgi:hypothetical protein